MVFLESKLHLVLPSIGAAEPVAGILLENLPKARSLFSRSALGLMKPQRCHDGCDQMRSLDRALKVADSKAPTT